MRYSLNKSQLVPDALDNAQGAAKRESKKESKWTPEVIQNHLAERTRRQAICDEHMKTMKQSADDLYKQGDYEEASEIYRAIGYAYGLKSSVLSNQVACFLKLGRYDDASLRADEGLKLNPKNKKLRFRRGQARKGRQRYHDALADFRTVLTLDPDCREARQEVEDIKHIIGDTPPSTAETYLDLADPRLPLMNAREYPDDEMESESEDFFHEGNTIPCKAYNRGACDEKSKCENSHAPDASSQRDNLGRNVCIRYLLKFCKFQADDCPYLHDKTYLPDGWWNDPNAVAKGRDMSIDEKLDPEDMGDIITPFLATLGHPEEYPRYRRIAPYPAKEKYELPHAFSYYTKAFGEQQSKVPKNPFVAIVAFEAPLSSQDCLYNLRAIEEVVPVEIIRSPQILAQRLDIDELAGVFFADASIRLPEHADLLAKVVQYVKLGGRVVFGGTFCKKIRPSELDAFFEQTWGLPWRFDERTKKTYRINIGTPFMRSNTELAKMLPVTDGIQLKNVPWKHCVYVPDWEFNISNFKNMKAPAAIARIQKGYLGYIGECRWFRQEGRLVLVMLGLFVPVLGIGMEYTTCRKIRSDFPDWNGAQPGLNGDEGSASSRVSGGGSSSAFPKTEESRKQHASATTSSPSGTSSNLEHANNSTTRPTPEKLPHQFFIIVLTFQHTQAFTAANQSTMTTLQDTGLEILCGLSDQRIIDLLRSDELLGIFVPYADITQPKHAYLVAKLVDHTKSGGKIVFGGHFASLIALEEVAPFFAKWGQHWKATEYKAVKMNVNPTCSAALEAQVYRLHGPLLRTARQTALHLSGVQPEAALVIHAEEALSLTVTTPCIYADIGKGGIGFIGHLELNEDQWSIVVTMFGRKMIR